MQHSNTSRAIGTVVTEANHVIGAMPINTSGLFGPNFTRATLSAQEFINSWPATYGCCSMPPVHQEKTSMDSSRWLVLLGVFGVYASFGVLTTSTAALVPSIRTDLDLSRGQMGLALGAWQLGFIVAAIQAGRLIDRIGLRRALCVSSAVMVGSVVLRAAAQDFATLFISVGLLGFGAPLVAIGAPKTVSMLFEGAERRRAVGLYQMAPAVGGAVALSTANGPVSALLAGSWRSISLFYAIVGAVAALGWWLSSDGLEAVDEEEPDRQHPGELLKLPIVRVCLLLATVGFMFSHGIGQWLVDLLADEGRTASTAGYLAAIGSLFGIVITGVVPPLATPRRRVGVLAAALLIGAFGTASLTIDGAEVIVAIAASSGARVVIMPIAMLMLMDHSDVAPKNMAVAAGLFLTAAQIGGFIGPYITGSLADSSGSFDRPMTLWAAVMAGVAVFVLLVLPRVTRTDPSSKATRREALRRTQ